ncbi:T9SS type A sorting domain-containing protein [Ekhidna sp.]
MRQLSCLTTFILILLISFSGYSQSITINTPIEVDDIVNASESGTVTISGTSTGGAVDMTIVRVTIGGVTNDATISGADGPWTVDLDISGESNGPLTVAAVYDPLGAAIVATNNNYAITLDQADPTATVTVDSDPISPSDLTQVVTVTYNEAMDPLTNPAISFSSSGNFTSNADGAWTVGNTVWTESFTHDGTSEQSFTETADVSSSSGATDVAGNPDIGDSSPSFVLDTQAPTATVTVDSDPIFQGDLVQVVTVTYDEAMDPLTNPAISFSSSGNFTSNSDGAWTVGNTVWTESYTHDGTAEEIASETADVASASGATDVVGIADVGDSSPSFVIDTQSPTATVTVDSDPITLGDLTQVVTVTYDEAMDPLTNPTITFSSSGNFTSNADGAWTSGNTVWTESYTHDGTAEEIASETADVASSSGATDAAGNADVGDSSPSFAIDTQAPTATVTIDSDPISPSDLTQVVTVTYDEAMDPLTNPTISFSSSGNFTSNADGVWTVGNTVWTESFTHDGTSEQSFTETADVSSSSGATDVAGNPDIGDSSPSFVLDTQAPTATVTVDSDPIFQGDLVQVVTVTYDEAMDPLTNPTISFSSSLNFTSNADGAWTVGNTVWTESYTHDGTAEEIASETADVASASGATDVVGIADIGDSSPGFVIDTQSPTATVTIDSDPITLGDLTQVVTVTYDEAMDPLTNPTITFSSSGNFTSNADGAWTSGNTVWTESYTHDGTAEEIASETADVASSSGATDAAGNADVGDSSPSFAIDTQAPTATVTIDSDPISPSDLTQVVTVTYDEAMDPLTNPTISFSSSGNFTSNADGVWTVGNTVWTESFTHDGTSEQSFTETADVSSSSGATDVAGNPDIGDSSPSFVLDTQAPTATVTVDSDPIFQGDLVQVVTVTYDEAMDPLTNPTISFSSSLNFTSNADGAWTVGNTVWTESYTHDGTAEEIASETADVASASGATDVVGIADIGDSSPGFLIDTQLPTFIDATFYDNDTDGSVDEILLEFSEDMDESSFDAADFDIGGAGLGAVSFSVLAAASANNGVDATETDVYVTLSVDLNSTDDRTIVYTQNDDVTDVSDVVGNQAADNAGLTTIDLAAPVLTDLRIEDTDNDGVIDQMTYVFSEIVFDIAGGVIDGDIGTLTMPDGATFDGGGGNALGDANVSLTNDGTYGLLVMDVDAAGYTTVGTDALAADGTGAAANFDDDQGLVGIEVTENIDDRAKPRIMNVSITGNSIADVTFSEPIWGNSGNSAPVTAANFAITLASLTGETIDAINATSVENSADPNALVGGEDEIRIFFSFSGTPTGGETLTIDTDGGIFDDSNNSADATQYPTDNEDDLSPPSIPILTIAEWVDQNNDGDIDGVAITFSVDWDIDEDGPGDSGDGLQCFEIRNGASLITQDGVDYDALSTNGFFNAGIFVTLQFTGDPQPGTAIGNLNLTYINDPGGNDRIESQSTNDDSPVGEVVTNGGLYYDGAAPRFANFSATILDDDADGNVDRIQVDAQDNIDDSAIDPSEFTYNGVAATGIANDDDNDESFTLLFDGNGTGVEGDFVYTIGGSLLDTAANVSNDGTINAASITDGAGPVILNAETRDTEATPDGLIDEILITFSEDLDNVYGSAANFSVDEGGDNYAVVSATPGPGADEVTLVITEGAFTGNGTWPAAVLGKDTYITPDVAITAGYGDDAAGALTPAQTFTNTSDGAAPYSEVDVLATNDTSPEITGSVDDPNATVLVNIGTSTVPATNNGDGTWTLADNSITGLSLGAGQEVTAICVDLSGNTETDVTSGELTINGGADITNATLTGLCIADGYQPLGDIRILETGNGDFGGSGTILLTLPAGFEFDTSIPAVSDGSSTLVDITVAYAYIGTATLQITVTYDGSDDGIDDLIVENLEVQAVTGGASGNLERAGGTAALSTTDTNYATLSSLSAPADITSLELVGPGTPLTSYTARFIPRVTINHAVGPVFIDGEDVVFSGGASGTIVSGTFSPTSFDMYLTDGTVGDNETVTGQTSGEIGTTSTSAVGVSDILFDYTLNANPAVQANWYDGAGALINSNGANNSIALSATTPGLYTYGISDGLLTAGNCESNPLPFNIHIYDDVHPDNNENTFVTKTYVVTDERDTIFMSNPAGHTVSITGNGVSVIGGGADPLQAIFDPAIAGDNGVGGPQSHTITYTITNNTTLESATETVTFTVEPETEIFTGPPAKEYCDSEGVITVTVDNTGFNLPSSFVNPYIQRVEAAAQNYGGLNIDYDGPNFEIGNFSGTNTPYEVDIDLNSLGIPAGEFENIRFLRVVIDALGVKRVDATNYFLVYGDPALGFSNLSLGDSFCSNDGEFTINRNIRYVSSVDDSEPNSPVATYFSETDASITNGYILYINDGVSNDAPSYGFGWNLVQDFTHDDGGMIDDRDRFFPGNPDQDGNTVEDESGRYLIEYTSEDSGPNNCSTTIYTEIDVFNQPSVPTLDAATMTAGSTVGLINNSSPDAGVDADEYLLEYCVGQDISSMNIYNQEAWVAAEAGTADDICYYEYNAATMEYDLLGCSSTGMPFFAALSVPNTATELSVDETIEFFMTQQLNGCESEFRKVTVTVHPLAPAPTITDTDATLFAGEYHLDFCADNGSSVSPVSFEMEALGTNEQYEYIVTRFNSANVEVSDDSVRISSRDIPIIAISDGERHEYKVRKVDNINPDGTSSFTGCVGGEISVIIYGFEEPTAVTAADFDLNTLEYHVGENATALADFDHTALADQYTWYETNVPGGMMGTPVASGGSFLASNLTGFDQSTVTTPYVDDVYTYYVTRTSNVDSDFGFDGCESTDVPTAVTITVHSIQRQPDIVSDNSASGINTTAFTDLNASVITDPDVDYYFSICTDRLEAVNLLVASESLYAGSSRVFRWYDYDITGPGTRGTEFTTDGSGTASLAELQLTALSGISTSTDRYFEIVQVTDNDVFEGTESESTLVRVQVSPQDAIEFRDDATDLVFGDEFCRDEALGNIQVDLFADGGSAGSANVQFEIVSYLDNTGTTPFTRTATIDHTAGAFTVGEVITGGTNGETAIVVSDDGSTMTVTAISGNGFLVGETITGGTSSTSETINTITTGFIDGNPDLNFILLHDGVDGSQDVGGSPTVHEINMIYLDPTTLCEGFASKTITINPDPSISFLVDGNDIGSFGVGEDQFCYEDGIIKLLGSPSGGTFTSSERGVLPANAEGGADFNTIDEHNAFHGVTGTDGEFLNRSTIVITYDYTDANGCDNSISTTLYVDPQPEVLEVTGLPATDLAATRPSNFIRMTNFCEDATAVDLEIQMIDPLDTDPGSIEEDDYTGYQFDWTINGNDFIVNNDNVLNYALGAGETNLVVQVVVTDINGCFETFNETHFLQELPSLDIVGISDGDSYCADDVDPSDGGSTLGLTDATEDGSSSTNAIAVGDIVSWSIDSYNEVDGVAAAVQIASGAGSFPAVDLDAWHTDAGLATPGTLVGGNATYHMITIVYQDPSRNYQGTATMCSNSVTETIIINPTPDIAITLNGVDADNLEFCYDDNISLQGIDLNTGLELNGGTLNRIRICDEFGGNCSTPVSSNGSATIAAATYHGTNPGDEFLDQSSHTIQYEYQDENGCETTVLRPFMINPRPRFSGDIIQTASTCATESVELFVDMTDGASNYTFTWFINGQEVNGVDAIDEDGNNNDERITYDFAGQLSANFGVTATYTGAGGGSFTTSCVTSITNQSITVGAEPIPAVSWVGTTAGGAVIDPVGNPGVLVGTEFTITEDNPTLPDGDVDLVQLEIDGDIVFSTTMPTFPLTFNYDPDDALYNFDTSGEYVVNLTMNTTAGCDVTLSRNIRILPHVTTINPSVAYSESFETAASFDLTSGGWLIDSLSLDGKTYYDTATSWTRSNTGIPGTTGLIDGGGAVFTSNNGSNGYGASEVSFVYSPSFDLSSFTAPTVSFLRYEDFETDKDGVVFQVSVDDGRSWQTVGTYDDDLEAEGLASTPGWYNSDGVSSGPGSSAPGNATASNIDEVGWANNSDWQEAISPIEVDPVQSGFVRFRFALSAQNTVKTTDGFGFDLVRIYERNQVVLLELFSSTLLPSSVVVNDTVNTRPQYSGADILKINYFTDLANGTVVLNDSIDEINQKNIIDPGAKVVFYGVGDVPSLAIAGDINTVIPSENPYSLLNAKLANARLNNPAFEITLNASVDTDGNLVTSADFSATAPFSDRAELALFLAVVEPTVNVPNSTRYGYYGTVAGDPSSPLNNPVIENVFRKMLPTAAGQYEQGPITSGDVRSIDQQVWPISNMFDPSTVRVIAYVQDLNTMQVYQATFVDIATGLSNNVLGVEDDIDELKLYPNPADEEVTLEFADGVSEDKEWIIFDQAGREVLKGSVERGTRTMTVRTSDLPSGLYFIHLYGEEQERQTKRVMVIH